jgi:hypothetical protein
VSPGDGWDEDEDEDDVENEEEELTNPLKGISEAAMFQEALKVSALFRV